MVRNQTDFAENTQRLNTGKKSLANYDTLTGAKDLTQVNGLLTQQKSLISSQGKAATELELAESALNNMKEILDQIKVDALQGASGTASNQDRTVIGVQLRSLGENLYALANTKLGDKYLFGGLQSNIKVISHVAGSLFDNASYKEGNADIGERVSGNLQASVGLGEILSTTAASAQYTGNAFTEPLASNAELNLVVNDGYNDIDVGDVALTAGDTGATIATKINTAFINAGGQGSIVSFSGGALNFDTGSITNNVKNSRAAIIVSPGTALPNSLSSIGLSNRTEKGTSSDLRSAFNKLDNAYNSNDSQAIREAIIDIDTNINRLISAKSQLGDLVSKLNES
jgi:flagellar hook-associated protein 3 FlgL